MRRLAVFVFVLVLAGFACGDDDDDGTESPGASPSGVVTTAAGPTDGGEVVNCSPNLEATAIEGDASWEAVLPDVIPAPPGYTVVDAEGAGPFLDVLRGDERVGSVELLSFELPEDFDPQLGFNALESWVTEFYDGIEADRTAADPSIDFTRDEPEPAQFGELCGVAYGFTVEKDGTVTERTIGHTTFDSEGLVIAGATYNVADPETAWTDLAALRDYEPFFRELVAQLRVPTS